MTRAGCFTEGGEREMIVAWLRYLDVFVEIDGVWYFAEEARP
jgi:hypothetical protein